jgi:hypothetical protein
MPTQPMVKHAPRHSMVKHTPRRSSLNSGKEHLSKHTQHRARAQAYARYVGEVDYAAFLDIKQANG